MRDHKSKIVEGHFPLEQIFQQNDELWTLENLPLDAGHEALSTNDLMFSDWFIGCPQNRKKTVSSFFIIILKLSDKF